MGLTLSKETSNRVSAVVLPPRMGRNEACHCGSDIKYKQCCREPDEALRRQRRGAVLPEWIDSSRSKLQQFEKYVCNVFGLPDLLASLVDTRRAPKIPTFDVVNSLFHTAVLRIPSINALEGDLKESDFQKLIGRHPTPEVKAFSADVVANVLDKLQLDGIHRAIDEVIGKAERNKAFRDGCYSALRCVALDGWEPFCSYDRHCPHCLVRKVKVKRRTGELEEVDQYYHSYVVAMLLGPVIDVVLGIEPVRNEEARRDIDGEHKGHEGELTAARRLIDSLHDTYGGFINAFVLDALYANGPVMTQLAKNAAVAAASLCRHQLRVLGMLAVLPVRLGYVRLNFTEASFGCAAAVHAVGTGTIWLTYALLRGLALLAQEIPVNPYQPRIYLRY
jgi:SEC-C motif